MEGRRQRWDERKTNEKQQTTINEKRKTKNIKKKENSNN